MKCPECTDVEIDDSGACPKCGFRPVAAPAANAVPPALPPEPAGAGVPEAQPAVAAETGETGELPPWRLELSRRLKEIKDKREGGSARLLREDRMLPFSQPEIEKPGEGDARAEIAGMGLKKPVRSSASRSSRRALRPVTRPQMPNLEAPPQKTDTRMPATPAAGGGAGPIDIVFRAPAAPRAVPDVCNVIDDYVSRQAQGVSQEQPRTTPAEPMEGPGQDGKLILLSRTLSGLVDILVVFLWTVAFIVAEDMFSGLEVFDMTSVRNGVLLLAANYFLYSLFFLGTANQTVGMMITNLRVVADTGRRPPLGSLLARCLAFPASLLVFGSGLLWGFFDKKSQCFHDRVSHTRVEPVAAV